LITGLRAEQFDNRNELALFEFDTKFVHYQISILQNGTLKEVEDCLDQNSVPQTHCTKKKGF
jgi:phosphoadenosine phosphosulfate reductase